MTASADELDRRFLRQAIDLADASVKEGGGPFGAVVVRDGQVLGVGTNRVVAECDPSAHAEVLAIRAACRRVGDFRLTGATLYTSCRPCPMCESAIHWARLGRVVYGASAALAVAAGFDDEAIRSELGQLADGGQIPIIQLELPEAERPFTSWNGKRDRVEY